MNIKNIIIFAGIILLPGFSVRAQQLDLFLNQDYNALLDKGLNRTDVSIHTGFKPLMQSQIDQYMPSDSLQGYVFTGPKKSWLYRKFYQESLFIIKDSAHKFRCAIDPLFNFQLSTDRSDSGKKFYQNTRGFLMQGSIGNKFSFSTFFLENQANYQYYIDQFVQNNTVVPGQGRVKLLPAKGGIFYSQGYDFSSSAGYVSYSPCKHVSIQFGSGKNFIGDGYRSLLLSDNSFNYPYLRVTTSFGHFQYTNLYTVFMNLFTNEKVLSIGTEGLFQKKAASFQYLSWNITPRLEWGIFQALIWQASDSNNKQHYNFYYFNPVIGVSPIRYGFNNTDNVLAGSTLKYKICSSMMAYGQLVIDDFPGSGGSGSLSNQNGFQLGLKWYNKSAEVMVEYNQVRPYTYSAKDSVQNYSHYNQALGDPLGANFREFIGIINYRFAKHFSVHLQFNYALVGEDYAGGLNEGSNIFNSDATYTQPLNNQLLQGQRGTLKYFNGYVSYLLNPVTNMNISVGYSHRELDYGNAAAQPVSDLIYVGFRTSIFNQYMDF